MENQLSIITNQRALYGSLCEDLPDGVKVISEAPIEQRGIDFVLNIDVIISFDLAKITALAIATWLITRSKRLKGNHKININDEQIPVDQPDAIELITNEIEHKAQNQK